MRETEMIMSIYLIKIGYLSKGRENGTPPKSVLTNTTRFIHIHTNSYFIPTISIHRKFA